MLSTTENRIEIECQCGIVMKGTIEELGKVFRMVVYQNKITALCKLCIMRDRIEDNKAFRKFQKNIITQLCNKPYMPEPGFLYKSDFE